MRQLILIFSLFLTLLSCSTHEGREIIFIDGVVQSNEQLEKLDSSEIFSFIKYRPGRSPERYYRGIDTTVIVVKTKKVETRLQQQRHTLLNRFLDSVDNGADILIVVNGILFMQDAQKQLRSVPSDSLSNSMTMEWEAAKKLYGAPARRITLIINTYDPKYNYSP